MELKEGDFSRVVRETNAARKARLVAIGQKVWRETNLRGAGNISEDDAAALGLALEKAGRWLDVARPKIAYEAETLQSIFILTKRLRKLLRTRGISSRLDGFLQARKYPIARTTLWMALNSLQLAAGEAAGHKTAAQTLRKVAGSPSALWVRRLAIVYSKFTGKKASQGSGSVGPFFRFVQAAAAQEPAKGFKLKIKAPAIRDALAKRQ